MASRVGFDLTEGGVSGHLVRLTIPMFLGIASMIVAAMIDTIYVGWIGTVELAAVSFTFPVVMALTTLPMGIGVGAASIIARVIGEKGKASRIGRISTDSLFLSALVVVLSSGAAWFFTEPLFLLLGAEPEILPLSVAYMEIWLLGMPVFAIPMVATIIMRATGNARLPGIIMTAGAGLQVLMAPVLIFGIPDYWAGLGFEGAAWGFVLSRVATFAYTLYALVKMRLLIVTMPAYQDVVQSWREVMRIGLPSVMTNLIGPVSMAVIVALLAGYGHEVVAGFGVASRIESLTTMILMALSASTGPFVGQNWGAGRIHRIHEAQRKSYRFSHLWAIGVFVLFLLAGRSIISLINSDPGVVEATYIYMLLMPASYGFLGVGMVAGSTFIALGKPMPPLILSVGRMIIVYLPLALLLERFFGYAGIFGAAAICNVLMGIGAVVWVRYMLKYETGRISTASVAGNAQTAEVRAPTAGES